jgi:hypothetical protein
LQAPLIVSTSRLLLVVALLAPACVGGGSGFIGAVSCAIPGLSSNASKPEIRFVAPDGVSPNGRIEVVNLSSEELAALRQRELLPEEWEAILRVAVAPATASNDRLPAVAGTYSATETAIVFTPLFGFDPGRRYQVAYLPASVEAEVGLPAEDIAPTTVVDRVYPTSDVVPENQLRFYVHFSAPMGLKGGLDYIKLLDPEGVEVKDPFLPLDTELWSGDRTRFTVFFDPGRVKRGILPNKEMGRSLTEGRLYTLVVSREWRDGRGLPLKEDFRRVFKVGPPDEQPVDQKSWRVEQPRPGTRDPLAVVFPEPLDHGLLLRALGVVSAGGGIEGETRIESGETRWTFTPREPWKAGEYRLRVLTILEDLAGNRIGRAFEVDQFERADRQAEPEEISIPFKLG